MNFSFMHLAITITLENTTERKKFNIYFLQDAAWLSKKNLNDMKSCKDIKVWNITHKNQNQKPFNMITKYIINMYIEGEKKIVQTEIL